MITIDGVEWDIPCDITRNSDLKGSDISGFLLDGSYFNDCMGQYLSYDIKLVAQPDKMDEYAQLYEIITDPVDGHSIWVPYNNGHLTITARFTNISDVYVRLPGGKPYWKGTTFTAVANHPSKFLNLGQVLTRGGAPLPDLNDDAPVGEVWRKDGTSGWVRGEYDDVDDVPY